MYLRVITKWLLWYLYCIFILLRIVIVACFKQKKYFFFGRGLGLLPLQYPQTPAVIFHVFGLSASQKSPNVPIFFFLYYLLLKYKRESVKPRMKSWETPVVTRHPFKDFPSRTIPSCLLLGIYKMRPNTWHEMP